MCVKKRNRFGIPNLLFCSNENLISVGRPSTSASFRVASRPIKILEIPPYRKSQAAQNPTAIVNPSPPRIQEIPPYRSRKSNDWQPTPVDNSNSEFQQLQLPQGASPEWVRRLKHADPSVIHRSVDCIANKVKFQNYILLQSTDHFTVIVIN